VGKMGMKPECRIQFEEKCYLTKLTFWEVRHYLDVLNKRHADIVEVITQHFNTIKKAILKEKQDKMYRQMRKDEEEQRKMSGKGSKTSRTGRSNRSGNETEQQKQERQKEETIQKIVIRDQLAADPDLQFDNPFICTPEKKLSQLYEFEETLLSIDKIQKENRRGLQTICRMQGSLS
jgi:Mg2+ and Co2+ transporter CorA